MYGFGVFLVRQGGQSPSMICDTGTRSNVYDASLWFLVLHHYEMKAL